jgi:multimeric flavodoxin WrbA
MKTLIFNGSPRGNGDTAFLVNELIRKLEGEVKVVDSCFSFIEPCNDCRDCWQKVGCSINDEMQSVYEYIKECDNIVIASPLHFSEVSGTLLSVMSRLQTYYASKRFLKINQVEKKKIGALILCGGGDGGPEKAEDTAGSFFRLMNAKKIKSIYSLKTDDIPSKDDTAAIGEIADLAELLNDEDK